MNAFTPSPLARGAAWVAAAFALLAALTQGFPHAWVSNAMIIALLAAAAQALFTARRENRPGLHFPRLSKWVVLTALAFTLVVLTRFALTAAKRETLSWSGMGHYVGPLVMVWLAWEVAPKVRKWSQTAILGGGLVIAGLFAIGATSLFPDTRLLKAYRLYVGNDAIWLNIGLGIVAAGVALHALWRLFRNRRDPVAWRWAALGLGFAAALLITSQSRSALLIFFCTVVSGSVLVATRWWQRLLAPVALVLVLLGAYSASPTARERISTAATEVVAALGAYRVETSSGQRLALASVSFRVWFDAPMLGHGLGTWRTEFAKRVPSQWQHAIGFHSSPHNEYLHIGGQLGWAGLVTYCAFLFALLALGVRALVRDGTPWLFVVATTWLIAGLTNVVVWDFRFFAPLSALLVCALSFVMKVPDSR